MRVTRSILLVVGVLTALAVFFSAPVKAAQELVPLITPPAGGGAYIIGAGLISVSNKYIQDTKLVHEAATGTMDIVRRMQARGKRRKRT